VSRSQVEVDVGVSEGVAEVDNKDDGI